MSYPTDAPGVPEEDDRARSLLGLSPLLVMTTNLVDALSLAFAAFVALVTAGFVVASIRRYITEAVRWPVMMLVVGLCTSTVMMLLHAFAFDLYQRVSFMVPILLTNWFVLVHLDRMPLGGAPAADSVTAASCASAALVIVGGLCEAIGDGTLLAGMGARPVARFTDSAFLIAAMAPGVFIVAGLLLAARNVYTQRT